METEAFTIALLSFRTIVRKDSKEDFFYTNA